MNKVMTSPDGLVWTAQTPPTPSRNWTAVTYALGLFVAVSSSGTGNRVMTSPDGVTWTTRTSASDINWISITYGNGLFVAVADTPDTNNSMTSPDGVTWTTQVGGSGSYDFTGISFANHLFVATAQNNSGGSAILTSTNGTTWTRRVTPLDTSGPRFAVSAYGNSVYVVLGDLSLFNNNALSSPDGITWTAHSTGYETIRTGLAFGNGIFVSVSADGNDTQCTMSADGVFWQYVPTPESSVWQSIAFGNNRFVAVAQTGTHQIMTAILQSTLLESALIDTRHSQTTAPIALGTLPAQQLHAVLDAYTVYQFEFEANFTADATSGFKITLDEGDLVVSWIEYEITILDNDTKSNVVAATVNSLSTTSSITGTTHGHCSIKGMLRTEISGTLGVNPLSNTGVGTTTLTSSYLKVWRF